MKEASNHILVPISVFVSVLSLSVISKLFFKRQRRTLHSPTYSYLSERGQIRREGAGRTRKKAQIVGIRREVLPKRWYLKG